MIIIPKYKATVDKLNSYYIDIKKLVLFHSEWVS